MFLLAYDQSVKLCMAHHCGLVVKLYTGLRRYGQSVIKGHLNAVKFLKGKDAIYAASWQWTGGSINNRRRAHTVEKLLSKMRLMEITQGSWPKLRWTFRHNSPYRDWDVKTLNVSDRNVRKQLLKPLQRCGTTKIRWHQAKMSVDVWNNDEQATF